MPRLRRKGHVLREINTLVDMRAWAAVATDKEVLEALHKRGQGQGWEPLAWNIACSDELAKRFRAWLAVAPAGTGKREILAVLRRFDQPEGNLHWVITRLAQRAPHARTLAMKRISAIADRN